MRWVDRTTADAELISTDAQRVWVHRSRNRLPLEDGNTMAEADQRRQFVITRRPQAARAEETMLTHLPGRAQDVTKLLQLGLQLIERGRTVPT